MLGSHLTMLVGAWLCRAYLVEAQSHGQRRALREIVTTTACRNIRPADEYPARLDLIYIYFLDYFGNDNNNGGGAGGGSESLDWMGVERAIASSVASTLNRCDDQRYPIYAVELSDASAHKVIATDECTECGDEGVDATGIQRSVVRGITSILLGENGASGMEEIVYPLIRSTLLDTFYLRQYTNMLLVGASLNRTIAASQIVLGNDENQTNNDNSSGSGETNKGSGRNSVWVGIGVAFVSFTLAGLLLFGLHRYQKKRQRHDTPTKERFARIQAKRRRYFKELEEDPTFAAGWMVTDVNVELPDVTQRQPTTVTWSVSDLTSDAESIIGSLPLDRIEEEENSKESLEIEADLEGGQQQQLGDATFRTTPSSSQMHHRHSPIQIDHLQFLAQWSEMMVQQHPALDGGGAAAAAVARKIKEEEEEEAKLEDPGFFDTVDLGSDSPLNESFRPTWFDQTSTEVSFVEVVPVLETPPLKERPLSDESGADGDDEGGLGETADTTVDLSDNDNDEQVRIGVLFAEAMEAEMMPPTEFSSLSFIAPAMEDDDDDIDDDTKKSNDSNLSDSDAKDDDDDDEDDCRAIRSTHGEYQMPLSDISNTVEEHAAEVDQTEKTSDANVSTSCAVDAVANNKVMDPVLASWAKGVLTILTENIQLLTYESHQE